MIPSADPASIILAISIVVVGVAIVVFRLTDGRGG